MALQPVRQPTLMAIPLTAIATARPNGAVRIHTATRLVDERFVLPRREGLRTGPTFKGRRVGLGPPSQSVGLRRPGTKMR